MPEIQSLFENIEVKKALIIDDAFDEVPRALDLLPDVQEWSFFFQDLAPEDHEFLQEVFPKYEGTDAGDLQNSDEFVAALWKNRERRPAIFDPLFERYIRENAFEIQKLDDLSTQLVSFGLTCERSGREFIEKALIADIIFIDLFLGTMQTEDAIRLSINGLGMTLRGRVGRPPIIVLMSGSTRLNLRREEFRDGAGVPESMFRVFRKESISIPGKLQRMLSRLANHYSDSLKLVGFLKAWLSGIENARSRTEKLIRTLDLSDYAQITDLLLTEEGALTGSYLVDVFDRVFQHELERDTTIIDSAVELNRVNWNYYPPPHIGGSRNLQNLVYSSIFQNPNRLKLPGSVGGQITFGDIIYWKNQEIDPAEIDGPLKGLAKENIFVVMTPACDLQRETGTKRVLLLVGSMKELKPTDWKYEETPIRTPIIKLNESTYWIKWDLKHVEAISREQIEKYLQEGGPTKVVARLRESSAFELQQKLLANIGRIGLIVPMPATFPVQVEVYYPEVAGTGRQLSVSSLGVDPGVCYVGQNGQKEMRLTMSEDACEEICERIQDVEPTLVHPSFREKLKALKENGDLLIALERGVRIPAVVGGPFREILQMDPGTPGFQAKQIAWTTRINISLSGIQLKQKGIVIAVREEPAAIAGDDRSSPNPNSENS
ncbi:MAG: hypothetical protein JWO30_330 [Fibrobacteres bacterium]|nr:hypothetical protein [Fibrobacterota bacterium]